MANLYAKNFSDADEVKNPPKAKVEVVKLGNVNASKLVLQPGWVWSECIKPTVGGESCQAGHVGVVISGRLGCSHNDGHASSSPCSISAQSRCTTTIWHS